MWMCIQHKWAMFFILRCVCVLERRKWRSLHGEKEEGGSGVFMGRTFESIHPLQKNIWALLGCSCSPGKVKFWLWNSGLFSPLSPSHHIK